MKLIPILIGLWALAAPAQDDAVKKLIRAGDEFYAKRDQEGMALKAIEAYKKALALEESCTEACWKATLAHYWLGNHEKDSTKQAEIFREAIDFAKMAVAIDENCIEAHFWLAVMYGLYGQACGILQSLHMVDPIKIGISFMNQFSEHRVVRHFVGFLDE